MATYEKVSLSGADHGLGIMVHVNVTLGTVIHTTPNNTTDWDEVWLWAVNTHTATILLTIEWGGVSVPANIITVGIPAQQGLILVVPGLILQDAKVVTAFAATIDKISISGFVNRITP